MDVDLPWKLRGDVGEGQEAADLMPPLPSKRLPHATHLPARLRTLLPYLSTCPSALPASSLLLCSRGSPWWNL